MNCLLAQYVHGLTRYLIVQKVQRGEEQERTQGKHQIERDGEGHGVLLLGETV